MVPAEARTYLEGAGGKGEADSSGESDGEAEDEGETAGDAVADALEATAAHSTNGCMIASVSVKDTTVEPFGA